MILSIEKILYKCYLDYSINIIIGRSLPDIRDGFKPVHRRILYSIKKIENIYGNNFKKSARIVGDVIGKYHPHGEMTIYDSIIKLVQHFIKRYIIIIGQGNFGSIDGDPAAAMRYTEIKMSKISKLFFEDIEYNTINYIYNYDYTEKIPAIFPSIIPNIILNGSYGITIGMITNIPPHNILEILSFCISIINKNSINFNKLNKYILGPDFPTGGIIYNKKNLLKSYISGQGYIYIYSKYILKKNHIIVTEIPYQINKKNLIYKIINLIKINKLFEINFIRDESFREKIKINIFLRKKQNINYLLKKISLFTKFQIYYNINMIILINDIPKLLNLKEILIYFIDYRKKTIKKNPI